jgi:hypothetical protein
VSQLTVPFIEGLFVAKASTKHQAEKEVAKKVIEELTKGDRLHDVVPQRLLFKQDGETQPEEQMQKETEEKRTKLVELVQQLNINAPPFVPKKKSETSTPKKLIPAILTPKKFTPKNSTSRKPISKRPTPKKPNSKKKPTQINIRNDWPLRTPQEIFRMEELSAQEFENSASKRRHNRFTYVPQPETIYESDDEDQVNWRPKRNYDEKLAAKMVRSTPVQYDDFSSDTESKKAASPAIMPTLEKTDNDSLLYYCVACDESFMGSNSWKKHLLSKNHAKKLVDQRGLLDDYRMARNENNEYFCDVCNIAFKDIIKYKLHLISEQHMINSGMPVDSFDMKQDSLKCRVCGFVANSAEAFLQHKESKQHREAEEEATKDKQWYCNVCRIETTSSVTYAKHLEGSAHKKNLLVYNAKIVLREIKEGKIVEDLPTKRTDFDKPRAKEILRELFLRVFNQEPVYENSTSTSGKTLINKSTIRIPYTNQEFTSEGASLVKAQRDAALSVINEFAKGDRIYSIIPESNLFAKN